MQTISTVVELRSALKALRFAGKTIGVVPTMGAFHEGHLTLMRRSRSENDATVVTLFVNPTQFNDPEDYAKYPRDTDRDARLAESEGVDFLFMPGPAEIYPGGFDTMVEVRGLSGRLEGQSRPGHFQGVATVVAKLLNIAGADHAYFGEKDWQQLQVIRRLTADLDIPTAIVPVSIIREPDGLAMSSRNVRLTADQRRAARVLSSALSETQRNADAGTRDAHALSLRLRQVIEAEPLATVDYAVVVDPHSLTEIDTIDRGAIALVAVTFGKVRLIDNREIQSALNKRELC